MEFIIAGLLLILALFILFKNLKAKKNGNCHCSSGCSDCSKCASCSSFQKTNLNTIDKNKKES